MITDITLSPILVILETVIW